MSERIVSALFTVEIHTSPNACPPDQPVGPAQSSIWLRFVNGPSGWWMPYAKSQHKAREALKMCLTVCDVVAMCRMWQPEET